MSQIYRFGQKNAYAEYLHTFTTLSGHRFCIASEFSNTLSALEQVAEEINYLGLSVHFYSQTREDFIDDECWIALGGGDYIENCLKEHYERKPISKKELLAYMAEGQFMQPVIKFLPQVWTFEDGHGDTRIVEEKYWICEAEIFCHIRCHRNKFLAQTIAPGYLDQTEPEMFDTENEALDYLIEYYAES